MRVILNIDMENKTQNKKHYRKGQKMKLKKGQYRCEVHWSKQSLRHVFAWEYITRDGRYFWGVTPISGVYARQQAEQQSGEKI